LSFDHKAAGVLVAHNGFRSPPKFLHRLFSFPLNPIRNPHFQHFYVTHAFYGWIMSFLFLFYSQEITPRKEI
jgi:hypothetical protein